MPIHTADLIDRHGDALASCETQFRQYGGRRFFHGPVRTIRTLEDNALIKNCWVNPAAARSWWWTAAAPCAPPCWAT